MTSTQQQEPDSPATPEDVPDVSGVPDVGAGQYMRGYLARLRAGDTGLLPVVLGLILIGIIFQITGNGHFLTAGNLVNLFVQGAFYMTLAMAAVFVLLLGEVDLSLGYVAGVGGVVCAVFATNMGWNWAAACLLALVATTLIGILQGLIITLLGLPSFVVTLAGLLGWNGVLLLILGNGATIPIQDTSVIFKFANGQIPPLAGWILYVVFAIVYAGFEAFRAIRGRARGLVMPSPVITAIRVVVVLLAALALVWICNLQRGNISGIPWAVLIVLAVLLITTFVMVRTRFGRSVYAIGGNAEAARRAGINLVLVRTAVFGIAGLITGVAGLIITSRLASVSTAFDGGTYVRYAIAAAVIGGTSLFGGHGRIIHGVLGGLVIAGIDNGMGLLSLSAATKFVVTALVLLVAVALDAIARRGRQTRGVGG
jgi:D-xylose transport system permease protein